MQPAYSFLEPGDQGVRSRVPRSKIINALKPDNGGEARKTEYIAV